MKANGDAIVSLRELLGLSGAGLARKTGISQGHISNIETGYRDPSPEAVKKIADVLGVTVADIVILEQASA